MPTEEISRSERFLKLYRVLEGLLEKRYMGARTTSPSVVMEYLRDPDSAPVRADLDLCREIRNLLSHNADGTGEPVLEPSEAVVTSLEAIVDYVRRPRLAVDYGTPHDRILFAHPNDSALDLMRHMLRMGYSHVPVRDRNGLVGVFSAGSLMAYVSKRGLDALNDELRVGDMKKAVELSEARSEKYLFFPENATLLAVRDAFDRRRERNSHVAAAFITRDGTARGEVIAMLTPWDMLKNSQ